MSRWKLGSMVNKWVITYQVLPSDLFVGFKWPFQGLSWRFWETDVGLGKKREIKTCGPGDSLWPFYPQTLEVTIRPLKGHVFTIPKRAQRITRWWFKPRVVDLACFIKPKKTLVKHQYLDLAWHHLWLCLFPKMCRGQICNLGIFLAQQ